MFPPQDMSLIRSKMDGDDSNSLQRRVRLDTERVWVVLRAPGVETKRVIFVDLVSYKESVRSYSFGEKLQILST